MLTFTQRKKYAAALCGLDENDTKMMPLIVSSLNTADKLLENAARRYWTRKEKVANITADKQYYQIASDMHRVATVRCKVGNDSDIVVPLTEICSEQEWNKLNSMPYSANYPTHFFIRGSDEIGLYPCPSTNITGGLIVSYEPRVRDMGIDDFTFTADVTQNGVNIENPDNTGLPGGFQSYMTENFWIKSNDGQDGNWYKVQKVVDSLTMQIDNEYLGPSGTGVSFTMGQVPPYPEEYHEAAAFYAAFMYYSARKDTESAAMYKSLFDGMLQSYRDTYGNKTTGSVVNPKHIKAPTIGDMLSTSVIAEGN